MTVPIQRSINILSIDGNSNGLPALYVLEQMFSRLKFDLKSDKESLPCEYFDIIGGAGTGALVALLLGRMKMTATEAIEAYIKLAPILSLPSARDKDELTRNSTAFEEAFCEILKAAQFAVDEPLVDEDSPKTLLFALNAVSMSAPLILRSYHSRTSNTPPCTILQAARACIAAQENFAPVTIGEGHKKVTLCDATTGYANPTSEILREAKQAVGGEVKVATVVSIGAENKSIRMSSGGLESQHLELLARTSVDCERIHEEMQNRLGGSGIYHRFKIAIEFQLPLDDIFGHVSAYLQQGIVSSAVDTITKSVQTRLPGPSLQDITSVTLVEIALKPRPSLARTFVGREDILCAMRQNHFDNCNVSVPSISVLTGLGGSGKTQIALKFALEYEELHPDAPVYFIDGSRETTLKTDLETVIRSQGPNHRSASYEDALIWLATKSKKWVLIIDNVDDPSIKLSSFIPRCSHGHIIITTRDATRKILAPDSTHVVEGLSTFDAVTLLLKTSGYEFNPTNETYAKVIVDELGHLPLALAHAAAYISIHQCLSTFLSIYRKSRAQLLESSPDLVQGYPYSVAATIQMSLDQISPAARDLLRIFAHLDARSIAYAVLAKAAERSFRQVARTKDDALQPATVEQADILMKIFCPSQEWIPGNFHEIISTCLQYSLLRVATQNEERFYSMHVLVQSYLQDKPSKIASHAFSGLATRLLGSAASTSGYQSDHFAFYRLLFPHVRLIKVENVIEAGDHYGFGGILGEMGDGTSSIVHLERCVEQWKRSNGEDDWNTLAAMTLLGSSYQDMGKEEKALEIRERALRISKRVRGDDDLETLMEMQKLAISYAAMGRDQEALKLREALVEKYRRLLGDEHRDTLRALHNLTNSYLAVGRHQEALKLSEFVLEKYKELLGDEHRDTVHVLHNLSMSYSAMGREQEALGLKKMVLEKRRRLLGDEHRHTLHSMHTLASSYSAVGRDLEALELREIVLDKCRGLLGDEHRHTLDAMYDLAASYLAVGREKESLELSKTVLERRIKLLGVEHRDTLQAMHNLAVSYCKTGTVEEALPTPRHVPLQFIAGSNEGHPDTSPAMQNLAQTYQKSRMVAESERLLQTASPPDEKLLDPDHKRIKWPQGLEAWVLALINSGNTDSDIELAAGNGQANRKRRRTLQGSRGESKRKCLEFQVLDV